MPTKLKTRVLAFVDILLCDGLELLDDAAAAK